MHTYFFFGWPSWERCSCFQISSCSICLSLTFYFPPVSLFRLAFFLCSVFQNTSLLSLGLFLLSLSSLLPLAFLRVLPALPWPLSYVIPLLWPYLAYKAREWPFFTRSCLTIVRHERLCFFEKKQVWEETGVHKIAPLCIVFVLLLP